MQKTSMRRPRPLAPASWLLAAAALAAGPMEAGSTADSRISFPDLARAFREAHGLGDVDVAKCTLGTLLGTGDYVSLDLGTFQLWFPAEFLGEKEYAAEFEDLAATLVDVHRVWCSWVEVGREGYDQATEDLETLRDWIESWSPRSLKRVEVEESPSLYDLLEAKDDVREAAERLRAFVQGGLKSKAYDGGWDEGEDGVHLTRLLLAPTRRSFVEHAAFAGEVDSEMRSFLWSDSSCKVNSAWCGRSQIVAMRNPVWPPDPDSPFQGSSMNNYDKKGQEQFFVERATVSLLRDVYYYYGIHFFESALSTNMVISVCGRNTLGFTWSSSWSRARAQTQSYSRFVPGGASGGGRLPQRQASSQIRMQVTYQSPWDRSKGEEFFLEPLQESQEDGAKAARHDDDVPLQDDELAHFEIETENGDHTVVTAPFFGPGAEDKELPPHEFLDAYEDFFRAYRSSFFEWMRMRALDDEEESRRRFAALVEAQANRESDDERLHAVVERVYGLPLSGENGEEDSLEWRFLRWLEDA